MKLQEIFLGILEKPDIPRYYRELKNFYLSQNMFDEANAIQSLLEIKFPENVHNSPSNSQ